MTRDNNNNRSNSRIGRSGGWNGRRNNFRGLPIMGQEDFKITGITTKEDRIIIGTLTVIMW